jgi:hypothetical protein
MLSTGRQLLNWARTAALMTKDEFTAEYSSFSATSRKQIASFPPINSMPVDCIFPWTPSGYIMKASNYSLLPPIMPSPPLSEAVPAPTSTTPETPSPAQTEVAAAPVTKTKKAQGIYVGH